MVSGWDGGFKSPSSEKRGNITIFYPFDIMIDFHLNLKEIFIQRNFILPLFNQSKNPLIMRIQRTALALFALLFLFTSFAPSPKGFPYQSKEGKLSVVFPGDFTTERTKGNYHVTVKTTCMYNNQTYFVSYTIHSLELTDPLDLAEASYDSFITAVKGVMISKTEWKVKELEGIQAMIDLPESGSKLDYRVIIVGNIQYQLIALAANIDYNEKGAGSFFKSFKIEK